ncbi:MAG: response regulator transcription factor [Comamonadaceae bacterium]|nr:MAG: response regulator transcription factor [Comamonadaceae bacterium]
MPTALIAEDEALLAQALQHELRQAWPALQLLGVAGDGHSAVKLALQHRPDLLFFDIRMPGQDGLSAAAELADAWPAEAGPLPLLVFVTAYDEYALRAFDAQALDYVLKPVQPERLQRTVARLQQALAVRNSAAGSAAPATPGAGLEPALAQWRALLAAAGAPAGAGAGTAPLRFITASDAGGQTLHMVPVEDVVVFEAADKYVRVLTATQEHLIRTPLKQLLPQLDAQVFWQVHRGTVVRADAIVSVQRDEAGRLHLTLRGRPGSERVAVSRLYAHLFRAM